MCVAVCQQHVDIGWVKVVSSVHSLFDFFFVMDGLWMRCTGSGIGSVSLFIISILTLDRAKLCPVCICFSKFSEVVDGFVLRCTGSDIGSVVLFFSNMLILDWSKAFPYAFAFFGVLGEYSLSTCEASDVILLLLLIAPS